MSSSAEKIVNEIKSKDREYLKLEEWRKSKYANFNWAELLFK